MRRFLRKVTQGGRVGVPLLLAVSAALLAAASAGAGGSAGYGCSAGFDLGGLTLDQALLLPRIQAGFAAGAGDPAGFTIFFNQVDHNGNGVVCVKTEPAGSDANVQPHWLYAYNFVDDNSSTPNA